MKDISILALFGINTDELENYHVEDNQKVLITPLKIMELFIIIY